MWRKQQAAAAAALDDGDGTDVARDEGRIVVNDVEDDKENGNGVGDNQGQSKGGKRAMGRPMESRGASDTASVSAPRVMPRRNRPTRPSRNGKVSNEEDRQRGNGKVVSVMDAAFQPDNDQRDTNGNVVSVMSAAATERSKDKNAVDDMLRDQNAVDKDTAPTPPSWVNPLKSCGPEHKCQIFQLEGVRTKSMYFDKCVEQCDLLQISHYFGWQCGGCRNDRAETSDSANATVHDHNATNNHDSTI
jgi:hypothetical protein